MPLNLGGALPKSPFTVV